jgi:hypothetical protein
MLTNTYLSFQIDPGWPDLGQIKPAVYWSWETQAHEIPEGSICLTDERLSQLNDNRDSWRLDPSSGDLYLPPQIERRYLRAVNGRIVEISSEERAAQDLEDFRTERERVRQVIAARRYEAECAGIVVDGIPIHTDRESQATFTSAFVSAQAGLIPTLRWKCQDGKFRELSASQVASIAQVLLGYVQACFDREEALCDLLDAVADMDYAGLTGLPIEEGWPEQVIALAS